MTRWLKLAKKVAKRGLHPKHQLGAVVVRGGSVMAFAANNATKHAEARACGNRDFTGGVLYVVRYRGTCSKPCPACLEAIRAANIHEIVYVDWDGSPVRCRVSR